MNFRTVTIAGTTGKNIPELVNFDNVVRVEVRVTFTRLHFNVVAYGELIYIDVKESQATITKMLGG